MASDTGKDTILVADDNPTNIEMLFDYLQAFDFEVLMAKNGEETLKQAQQAQPDLILLDVMMPDMDGFETCRFLKEAEETKDIPVIFMTALSGATDKLKGFEVGGVDYITKPIHPKEVLARINIHLTIGKLQKSLREQNQRLKEENTRRKRVMDALQESRERYRLLAENSIDMISRQTPEGIYLYVSPACRPLMGYEIEEMVGRSVYDFFHPDDLATVQELGETANDWPPISTITHRGRRKDGRYVWIETTNRVIREPKKGLVVEIVASSRDISDRKEAEQALQEARDELEQRVAERTAELARANAVLKEEVTERKRAEAEIQAYSEALETKNEALSRLDQLKDEFLANTSHELRTPLNGVIGIAESMVDGATGHLTPEQTYNLSMIVTSGRRLFNLVNDILDFSKLKHHALDLRRRPVSMKTVTEVVFTLSQPLIQKKEVQLVNKLDAELPLVNADESRLQQIMHNLVGNAIKFTLEGTVTVSARVQEEMLEVSVSDTGIGIPPDKLEMIFQSFEQVDASITRSYSGSGLGLSITRQLVELHGGTVRVDSVVDQGSTFTFTLPLAQEADTAAGEGQASDVDTPSTRIWPDIEPVMALSQVELAENKEFTVLVVDDELINVQVLTNYLSLQNYAVSQAFNGFEALDAVEEIEPDLVLLDVMMPKISGYEVCKKIRERYPAHELPVVLLTAKNQSSDLVAGFESGANDYLTKPIDKNELLARVKTHLRLAKINVAYGRFVPHEFLRFLEKESIIDVQLGDHMQHEMTILFSDIRSFTDLSEEMSPQENFNFLNSYLGRVSPIIRQYNGFIDKYIGDTVMALFPSQAKDALQAAIAMRQELAQYNRYRRQQGRRPIDIGAGIHRGLLTLGTIGEIKRMEGTVISDAVNLASRLEGLTKRYGAGIIISEHTLFGLDQPTQYNFRFLDRVQVKGKKEPVSVFEIFDGDPEELLTLKLKTRTDFEKGLLYYHSQEFEEAKSYFQQVIAQDLQDKAAQIYLKRTNHFIEYGVPPDWEGVEALTEK